MTITVVRTIYWQAGWLAAQREIIRHIGTLGRFILTSTGVFTNVVFLKISVKILIIMPHLRFSKVDALLIALLLAIGVATLPRPLKASYTIADQRAAADVVMTNMHEALPEALMEMDGRLQVHDRRGRVESTYEVELVYERDAEGLAIDIEIRDAFGTLLENISVSGIGTAATTIDYFVGSERKRAELPNLAETIRDTDFRWQDLTLSFLWWSGGELTGVEAMKGRQCYIVKLPNPDVDGEDDYVELWIDSEMYVLLRARFYTDSSETKRFDVKSFARSGDLWMVKDIDMRSFPSRRRSSFRVRNVEQRISEEPGDENEK